MSPTPSPTPLPDHLEGSLGTSPSGLDSVLTEAAETAKNSSFDFGENLDAALGDHAIPTLATVDYYRDLDMVMVSASPWLIVAVAAFVVVAFVASVITAFVIGMNRAEKRAQVTTPDPRITAQRLAERAAREEVAAMAAGAAEDADR